MELTLNNAKTDSQERANSKAFWVLWSIELWERFGYYGTQAVLSLYFVHKLGYTEKESFYVFGSFSAFVYGFVWIGGYLGDHYLGAKRTLFLGAIVLMYNATSNLECELRPKFQSIFHMALRAST